MGLSYSSRACTAATYYCLMYCVRCAEEVSDVLCREVTLADGTGDATVLHGGCVRVTGGRRWCYGYVVMGFG